MDAAPFAFAEVQVYGVWLCYVFIHQKKKAEKTSLILRASLFFFFYQKTKTLQHETYVESDTPAYVFIPGEDPRVCCVVVAEITVEGFHLQSC